MHRSLQGLAALLALACSEPQAGDPSGAPSPTTTPADSQPADSQPADSQTPPPATAPASASGPETTPSAPAPGQQPTPDSSPSVPSPQPVAPTAPESSPSSPETQPPVSDPEPSASTPAEAPTEPSPSPEPTQPVSEGACSEVLELPTPAFDCGDAHVFEDNGPPGNRVNYVIVPDGYTEAELDSALVEHVENMLYNPQTGMYSEIGEPYTRYRKFINVCALRAASNESGADGPNGQPDIDTLFGGGNCGDRLGCVDDGLVLDHLSQVLPEHVDPDWVAATLNTNEWWNSGGRLMVWSGKFMETDADNAASVALHEGGHSFHQLADEYGDENLNCNCESAREPNVSCETSDTLNAESKWAEWIGYVMEGGSRLWNLGEHGIIPGGRYCGPSSNVARPTQDSEMNLLPYAHNMPSIQKIIHDIYAIVRPIDVHTPNTEPQSGLSELSVRVVDPEVIKLEWTVDGQIVAETGECLSLAELAPGEHLIQVRAYDDTPWVRDQREDLEQVVEWSVTLP